MWTTTTTKMTTPPTLNYSLRQKDIPSWTKKGGKVIVDDYITEKNE